jgi:hypothetical protein
MTFAAVFVKNPDTSIRGPDGTCAMARRIVSSIIIIIISTLLLSLDLPGSSVV